MNKICFVLISNQVHFHKLLYYLEKYNVLGYELVVIHPNNNRSRKFCHWLGSIYDLTWTYEAEQVQMHFPTSPSEADSIIKSLSKIKRKFWGSMPESIQTSEYNKVKIYTFAQCGNLELHATASSIEDYFKNKPSLSPLCSREVVFLDEVHRKIINPGEFEQVFLKLINKICFNDKKFCEKVDYGRWISPAYRGVTVRPKLNDFLDLQYIKSLSRPSDYSNWFTLKDNGYVNHLVILLDELPHTDRKRRNLMINCLINHMIKTFGNKSIVWLKCHPGKKTEYNQALIRDYSNYAKNIGIKSFILPEEVPVEYILLHHSDVIQCLYHQSSMSAKHAIDLGIKVFSYYFLNDKRNIMASNNIQLLYDNSWSGQAYIHYK